MRRSIIVAHVAPLLLCGVPTQAAPILWTFQNVVFEDGGTMIGSFVYDPDADVFSAVNVITTPGRIAGSVHVIAEKLGQLATRLGRHGLQAAPVGEIYDGRDLAGGDGVDVQIVKEPCPNATSRHRCVGRARCQRRGRRADELQGLHLLQAPRQH